MVMTVEQRLSILAQSVEDVLTRLSKAREHVKNLHVWQAPGYVDSTTREIEEILKTGLKIARDDDTKGNRQDSL